MECVGIYITNRSYETISFLVKHSECFSNFIFNITIIKISAIRVCQAQKSKSQSLMVTTQPPPTLVKIK